MADCSKDLFFLIRHFVKVEPIKLILIIDFNIHKNIWYAEDSDNLDPKKS